MTAVPGLLPVTPSSGRTARGPRRARTRASSSATAPRCASAPASLSGKAPARCRSMIPTPRTRRAAPCSTACLIVIDPAPPAAERSLRGLLPGRGVLLRLRLHAQLGDLVALAQRGAEELIPAGEILRR